MTALTDSMDMTESILKSWLDTNTCSLSTEGLPFVVCPACLDSLPPEARGYFSPMPASVLVQKNRCVP